MADREDALPPRRRGRPAGATARRRRLGGAELMATLNEQVMELIKENRRLKREVAKLADETSPAVNGSGEKTLRSLQRKVQRAVAGAKPVASRRRTTTSGTARRRRPSEATQASAAD